MKQGLTVAQVAEHLGVQPNTIYNLIYRGELIGVKVGRAVRIMPESLDQFIAANNTQWRGDMEQENLDLTQYSLGKQVRILRTAHGITVTELAGILGVGPSRLSEAEIGRPEQLLKRAVSYLESLESKG